MEKCDITLGGRKVGTLSVRPEGLNTVFLAETERLAGLRRLCVLTGGEKLDLGVLSPSREGLRLCRSFTKRGLQELGFQSLEGAEIAEAGAGEWRPEREPWKRFSDPVLRSACQGAEGVLRRGDEMAFPVREGESFALTPAFCLGKSAVIEGRGYLVFDLRLLG